MQRLPKVLIGNIQLPSSLPVSPQYTVPTGATTTISAVLFNSTGASATVTMHIVPPAGSATNANQVMTTVSIPASGAAPTAIGALVGENMAAGTGIFLFSSAATTITPLIAGYETT